ncbi:hypothetical protein GQ42DRAFT_57783 [Ramicandelaber brevisporus]|nr:hypothetical protein GQ42DRAFT_57783 [Ramicandelaber brevisporus]
MKLCGQCKQEAAKYKCPACVTPYCSLACFKLHKQDSCQPAGQPQPQSQSQPSVAEATEVATTTATTTATTIATTPNPEDVAATSGIVGEEDAAIYGLTADMLAQLRSNKALLEHLQNDQVRSIMKDLAAASADELAAIRQRHIEIERKRLAATSPAEAIAAVTAEFADVVPSDKQVAMETIERLRHSYPGFNDAVSEIQRALDPSSTTLTPS